jgi:minichromosome maintenance protein 10
MEFNTMPGMSSGKSQGNGPGGGKKGFGGYGGKHDPNGLKREGRYHDKYLHETMYIAPKELGLNAASLLDNESSAAMQGLTAKEARRKRRRDQEKENELARKLGMKGNGAGSEYLNHHRKITSSATSSVPSSSAMANIAADGMEPPDAAALGLLSKTAQDVSLSPVKGRKRGFKLSKSGASEPIGWSGAFKRGMLEPKESSSQASSSGERVRAMSPRKSSMKQVHYEEGGMSPRKKARLLLPEKGIREPGRESFGGTTPGDIFLDDDELSIV